MKIPWFTVTGDLPTGRRTLLVTASFLLPLAVWCMVSYVPFIWHPLVLVEVSGGSSYRYDDRAPKEDFRDIIAKLEDENALRAAGESAGDLEGKTEAQITRENKAILKQFGEVAVANGWMDEAGLRKPEQIVEAMKAYEVGGLAAGPVTLSAVNRQIVADNLGRLTLKDGEVVLPDNALLLNLIPQGTPANPVFLPPPHAVARAFYTAFVTPPRRAGEPWLHERLGTSIKTIVYGFGLACVFGVPLGVLCGAFPFFSRVTEPSTNFISYIPPPAFGSLLIAIFGIDAGPKVAMVFIAAFFPMVLMVGKTTRMIDTSLLEAGQTLGASRKRMVTRIIVPGILPNVYNDLRIILALSWTILIIAELTGTKSGISGYMQQQGRYRNFDNVFAAMVMIGIIGFATDQALHWLRRVLFPWAYGGRVGIRKRVGSVINRVSNVFLSRPETDGEETLHEPTPQSRRSADAPVA